MRKYNGAISLFMIIIMLSSFIFGGLFIDMSRIVVAKNKVRTAMNSALRSSVSHYDKTMVGEYGLYGFDKASAGGNFEKYFKANMLIEDEGLKMFDYNIVRATASSSTRLTNDTEFKRQILEYSKYRAPVTTTLILVDKIKDAFTSFTNRADKISEATDALDEFKKQYEIDANQIKTGLANAKTTAVSNLKTSVNNKIEAAKDDISVLTQLANDVNTQFGNIDSSITSSSNTMDKMERDTSTYKTEATRDINEIEGLADGGTTNDGVGDFPTATYDENGNATTHEETGDVSEQADNQTGSGQVEGTLRRKVREYDEKVQQIRGQINELLGQVGVTAANYHTQKGILAEKNADVANKQEIYNEKSRVFSNAATEWSNYQTYQRKSSEYAGKITEADNQINDARESYSGNTEYVNAINSYLNLNSDDEEGKRRLRNSYNALHDTFNLIDDYKHYISRKAHYDGLLAQSNGSSIQSSYNHAQSEKTTAETNLNNSTAARDTQQGVVNAVEAELDSLKSQLQTKLDNLKNLTIPKADPLKIVDMAKSDLTNTIDGFKEDVGFNTLKEFYEQLTAEITVYTTSEDTVNSADSKLTSGILKKIKELCDYGKSLFELVTNFENIRNQAYMVDYVMDKCTYLTSQTTRNHYFQRGEVEYIIFGNKTQMGNIAASITTISLIRFSINFLDYFITGPGDLIGKAVYALGRGAAKTALDMKALLITSPDTGARENIRDGVGLCPSFDHLKLTYSDYLRLMLFMNLNKMQPRLKDTINTNIRRTLSGCDLQNIYARMKASVEVEVDLIILPGFFGEFTGANFRNGKYVIKDNSTLGY